MARQTAILPVHARAWVMVFGRARAVGRDSHESSGRRRDQRVRGREDCIAVAWV